MENRFGFFYVVFHKALPSLLFLSNLAVFCGEVYTEGESGGRRESECDREKEERESTEYDGQREIFKGVFVLFK